MRKKVLRLTALVLAAAMLFSLTACGGSDSSETTTKAAETTAKAAETTEQAEDDTEEAVTEAAAEEGISADSPYAGLGFDFSEHRDLTLYAISDRPAGLDEVLSVLNTSYLEPWLNVTLTIELLPWGVASDKYKLLLAGGEKVDMIYSASWMGYTSYANQGAFVELTEEMLQKYLVYSYEIMPSVSWKQASVAGKIYGICRNLSEYSSYNMVVIRQDLLDEGGYTEDIDSFADLEDALMVIRDVKKDDAGFYPCGQRGDDELAYLWYQENNMARIAADSPYVYTYQGTTALPDPSEVYYLYTSDMWHDYIVECAKLAAEEIWSPNAINESEDNQLLFESGRTGMMSWNTTINSAGANMEAAGVGTYQIYDVSRDAYATPGNYSSGMVSIPNACEDIERSLLTIDLLKSSEECMMLLCGGIEGKHYTMTEDGYREVGPEEADYQWCSWNWMFQDDSLPTLKASDERQDYFVNQCKSKHVVLETAGFVFDENPVADELTVLSATLSEYRTSFDLGMFGQGEALESKWNEFLDRMDESYLDVIMEEVVSQYTEYYNENN